MIASSSRSIWFWQRIISPHMAGLASAVASTGCRVTYVVEKAMSEDRMRQGWSPPELPNIDVIMAASKRAIELTASTAPADSVHICQGLRGNGLIRVAQDMLARRGLRQWVVMESVDDSGLLGIARRCAYARIVRMTHHRLQGVLAIGHSTRQWIIDRGMPEGLVYPFAYFLPCPVHRPPSDPSARPFRFIFVGQFIRRKNLRLLIDALSAVPNKDFELEVVGSGALEAPLRALAEAALVNRVRWVGRIAVGQVPDEMIKADCLVLPSRYDGWGAVVSESMMVGTPAICSDACGIADLVRASGRGGVFRSGDGRELQRLLETQVAKGPVCLADRISLSEWATCTGSTVGAAYFLSILMSSEGRCPRPQAPWDLNT